MVGRCDTKVVKKSIVMDFELYGYISTKIKTDASFYNCDLYLGCLLWR